MKKYSFISLAIFLFNVFSSVGQQFDQLKFKVPPNWSQQSRNEWVSFSGKEPETSIFMEIRVFKTNPYKLKPDSAFKLEWASRLDNQFNKKSAIPFRKKYNQESLQYFEAGSEALDGTPKRYRHLFSFVVNKGLQTIELLTGSKADFKKLGYYLSDFINEVLLNNVGK